MSVIYVIAELSIKPGTAEKVATAARSAVAATVKEDGCISYDSYFNVSDPARLVLVERWASREALSRHLQTPHFKAWRTASAEFVTGRKVEIVTPEKVETP
jgi:quinol monooxygenase YgiN